MPVPHLRPSYQSPGLRSSEHAKREKVLLEGLRRSSAFKPGTLVRECRFYIGGKEKSRRIEDTATESEASPAGRRAGSTRPGTGVARRRTIQEWKRRRGREAPPESQERE